MQRSGLRAVSPVSKAARHGGGASPASGHLRAVIRPTTPRDPTQGVMLRAVCGSVHRWHSLIAQSHSLRPALVPGSQSGGWLPSRASQHLSCTHSDPRLQHTCAPGTSGSHQSPSMCQAWWCSVSVSRPPGFPERPHCGHRVSWRAVTSCQLTETGSHVAPHISRGSRRRGRCYTDSSRCLVQELKLHPAATWMKPRPIEKGLDWPGLNSLQSPGHLH